MEKYPIYLNFEELYGHIKSLPNSDEKISYCKYILNIFRESFKNKTDADIEKYIENIKIEFNKKENH